MKWLFLSAPPMVSRTADDEGMQGLQMDENLAPWSPGDNEAGVDPVAQGPGRDAIACSSLDQSHGELVLG